MPIVKAISGHTSCQKVKTYLEKRNRALARDFYNLSWDEREMEGFDEALKDAVEWADEMDLTRAQFGNDQPYEGAGPARTSTSSCRLTPMTASTFLRCGSSPARGRSATSGTSRSPLSTTTTTRTASRTRT